MAAFLFAFDQNSLHQNVCSYRKFLGVPPLGVVVRSVGRFITTGNAQTNKKALLFQFQQGPSHMRFSYAIYWLLRISEVSWSCS